MSESDIFLAEETYDKQQYIYDPGFEFTKGKEAGKSLILSFISQLKPGMDVTRIQAPLLLLKPVSFLERSADYVKPNPEFVKISSTQDPVKRMLLISKWLLSNLSITPQKGFSRSKPYNPILGEQFICSWDHEDSTTHLVSEQVSHHPPVSSLVLENRKHNWVYTSTTLPRSTFLGNKVEIHVEGEHKLHLLESGEVYTIGWPMINGRGIIFGSSVIEQGDFLTISSNKSEHTVKIEFKKKKSNEIVGSINLKNQVLYTISGNLDKIMYIKNNKGQKYVLLDSTKINHMLKRVAPISKQKTNESRRVWHPVTFELLNNDYDKAALYKNLIEERQRRLAKERKDNNEKWECIDFKETSVVTKSGVPIFEYTKLNLKPTKEELEDEEELDLD